MDANWFVLRDQGQNQAALGALCFRRNPSSALHVLGLLYLIWDPCAGIREIEQVNMDPVLP